MEKESQELLAQQGRFKVIMEHTQIETPELQIPSQRRDEPAPDAVPQKESLIIFDFNNEYAIDYRFHRGSTWKRRIIFGFAELGIDLLFTLSVCCLFLLFNAWTNSLVLQKNSLPFDVFFYVWTVCLFQYQVVSRVFVGFTIGEWACSSHVFAKKS